MSNRKAQVGAMSTQDHKDPKPASTPASPQPAKVPDGNTPVDPQPADSERERLRPPDQA